jgi:hypothetical protein
LALLEIILLAWILVQTEPVQNFLVKKINHRLSRDLKTEVRIEHVSFTLFDRMNLDGTLIRDLNKDTLLYAGALKVRISDWFFLKKNIDLNYIGLENAKIHAYRKDSVWNYQFLIDHFSSSKKDTTPKQNIGLNLKKVDLKNVAIDENDLWVGERTSIKLGSLILDADNIDLNTLNFKINLLEIDKPFVLMDNFKGRRPQRPSTHALKDTGLYFNNAGIFLKADSVQITDGKFVLLNNNRPHEAVKYFDPDNIQFSHINLSARKIAFVNDTLVAGINLSTRERSGLDVRKLLANFRLTPQIMEFKNLDLHTDNSYLHNYYAMKFKDFNEDMNDFTNKVKIVAHFNNAVVSSKDVAFFAPELADMKLDLDVEGQISGLVNNLKAKHLSVKTGKATYIKGDFILKGLPKLKETFMDLKIEMAGSNKTDLDEVVAGITNSKKKVIPSIISKFGNINFNGNFTGFMNDFIA